MPKDTLPPDTIIELVATKNNQVHKQNMPYHEALKLPKKKGWNYQYYQKGFCNIKPTTQ